MSAVRPAVLEPAVGQSYSAAKDNPGTGAVVAVRLRGVTRSYAGQAVWAPLDLTIMSGTLCVVTGPNGSGKSTLLRIAAGLLRPSQGRRDGGRRSLYVRGGGGLRSVQTVREAVRSTAALAGCGEADATLELLRVHHLAERRIGTLSAGERVRAALAVAIATCPTLLCLDEPTAALDDAALHDLLQVVLAVRRGGTAVLVATHQPALLLPAADAHLRLQDGQVVAG